MFFLTHLNIFNYASSGANVKVQIIKCMFQLIFEIIHSTELKDFHAQLNYKTVDGYLPFYRLIWTMWNKRNIDQFTYIVLYH